MDETVLFERKAMVRKHILERIICYLLPPIFPFIILSRIGDLLLVILYGVGLSVIPILYAEYRLRRLEKFGAEIKIFSDRIEYRLIQTKHIFWYSDIRILRKHSLRGMAPEIIFKSGGSFRFYNLPEIREGIEFVIAQSDRFGIKSVS